jgi:hypothetical protein
VSSGGHKGPLGSSTQVSSAERKGNGKLETGNRKRETDQLAGFPFPVFGFLFFIVFLFASGSAGLGRTLVTTILTQCMFQVCR